MKKDKENVRYEKVKFRGREYTYKIYYHTHYLLLEFHGKRYSYAIPRGLWRSQVVSHGRYSRWFWFILRGERIKSSNDNEVQADMIFHSKLERDNEKTS